MQLIGSSLYFQNNSWDHHLIPNTNSQNHTNYYTKILHENSSYSY